jgi:hypothetical protein
VANSGSNNVSVLLGNGDGSFQDARSFAAGSGPRSVAAGDFNGDGLLDLAVAGDSGVSVLLGNGDGSFQDARIFGAGYGPNSVAVGDFNGDGLLDLAVAVSGSGARVLLGNGDGTFQTTNFSYVTGSVPFSIAVGDFNGDGWPDLAAANNFSNDVSILLNDGAWTGPHRGSGGGQFRERGAGVPQRPALHHPAVVGEAQLAAAAFPDLRWAAPAVSVGDAAPALPPPDSARPERFATPAPAPRQEKSSPPTRARPAALPQPPLLDLVFADTLAAGIDGKLAGDRRALLA